MGCVLLQQNRPNPTPYQPQYQQPYPARVVTAPAPNYVVHQVSSSESTDGGKIATDNWTYQTL